MDRMCEFAGGICALCVGASPGARPLIVVSTAAPAAAACPRRHRPQLVLPASAESLGNASCRSCACGPNLPWREPSKGNYPHGSWCMLMQERLDVAHPCAKLQLSPNRQSPLCHLCAEYERHEVCVL